MWPSSLWYLRDSLWLIEWLLLKTTWNREALYKYWKEVGEECLNELSPLRTVDSSKQFIKKKKIELGKLRHEGVKINFLILYRIFVVETVTEQNLYSFQLGISFTGPALFSRKRKSHFKVIIVKRPQVPQYCKRLPRSYLTWIILIFFG